MSFFAHGESRKPGRMHYRDRPRWMIGVLRARDDYQPCGMAGVLGWDRDGAALFYLIVGGHRLPGRYWLIDDEFIETQAEVTHEPWG